jgi:hypothetical protein
MAATTWRRSLLAERSPRDATRTGRFWLSSLSLPLPQRKRLWRSSVSSVAPTRSKLNDVLNAENARFIHSGGETAMATWKRLTSTDRHETYVNIEQIAYMQRDEGHTVVIFAVATIEGVCSVNVTETPNQILDAPPLRSAQEPSGSQQKR